MPIQIEIPHEPLVAFCNKRQVREFALFGSVLRPDFRADSDIDVLLSFAPDARWSLFDQVEMNDELEALFGRKVDLVTRYGIERSRNTICRKAILEPAQVIHAA